MHSHVVQDPSSPTLGDRTITGHLQHAPYPFRTLSGVHGALRDVRTWIGPLPSAADPDLTHVVIHGLPGLHGPRLQHPIDPADGLSFNSDQFPIELDMERGSLQRTSALDTIPEFPGETDRGRRFSLEPQIGSNDPRNLQTYLQIIPSQPPEEPRSSDGATDLELARRAAREMVERFERIGGRR